MSMMGSTASAADTGKAQPAMAAVEVARNWRRLSGDMTGRWCPVLSVEATRERRSLIAAA
jgi:hypothetical protein